MKPKCSECGSTKALRRFRGKYYCPKCWKKKLERIIEMVRKA